MAALTPYPVGKDPTFDAQSAQADYRRANAQADYTQRTQQADQGYKQALSNLDTMGQRGSAMIDNRALSRGVFSSGETNVRQADLQGELLRRRAGLDQGRASVYGQASADLQRALTSLDLQTQADTAAAMARNSGGGGGGGYAQPAPTPWAASVPATTPAPVAPGRIGGTGWNIRSGGAVPAPAYGGGQGLKYR